MSFAFTVKEARDEYNELRDDVNVEMLTVTKIDKVFDVSAVDIPAYDSTSISARSVFDAEREKKNKEIEERNKQLDLARARFFYV